MIDACEKLTLDVRSANVSAVVNAKQWDTGRRLWISLAEGGKPYRIESDCYAVFAAKKPDGKVILNPCRVDNDSIEYCFTQQTCAAAGSMPAEIKLYGGNGKLLTSASFLMEVHPSVFSEEDEIVSTDEVQILDGLIQETRALKEELRSKLENGEFTGPSGEEGPRGETGAAGPQGPAGEAGRGIASLKVGEDGAARILYTDGTWDSFTIPKGEDGIGIEHIQQTVAASEDGGTNILTITLEDGRKETFHVKNGAKGDRGEKGESGSSVTVDLVRHSTADGEPNTVVFSNGLELEVFNGSKGATGKRGPGVLKVTTAPTSYTTETAGVSPIKRMSISTIKTQAGVSEVLIGDQVSYSYYLYHIYYKDATYAYMDVSQSIRGATGSKGATGDTGPQGPAYTLTDTDKTSIAEAVLAALPTWEGGSY